MKAKLGALVEGLIALVLELALLYPAYLLDQEISRRITLHFGFGSDWILWIARAVSWSSMVAVLIAAYLGGQWLLERWRRNVRIKSSLAQVAGPSKISAIGSKDGIEFNARTIIKLVVPDAIVAVDGRRGLLRLKSIASHQDSAINLAHVIGMEFRRGEARAADGCQSMFRHYDPKFRTLSELPRIRLEIATEGKEPVLEYFLFADLPDAQAFEAFFGVLQRAARTTYRTKIVSTRTMLDSLPIQGSKYGYGWIGGDAAGYGKSLETRSSARNSPARLHASSLSPRNVIVRSNTT